MIIYFKNWADSRKSGNFAKQNFNKVYIVMAQAQLTKQLFAASGVLHRVQESYAMTMRLR